jgi:hypothetical protein
MGCDIHGYIEIKIDGQWVTYSRLEIDRDYDLFGKIAGVRRGDIEPVALPRGIPSDVAAVVNLEIARDNYHSFTWLTLEEMEMIQMWWHECRNNKASYKEPWGCYLFGNDFSRRSLTEWDIPRVTDVRAIIWFDN